MTVSYQWASVSCSYGQLLQQLPGGDYAQGFRQTHCAKAGSIASDQSLLSVPPLEPGGSAALLARHTGSAQ